MSVCAFFEQEIAEISMSFGPQVETADFYAAAISTDFVTSAKVMTVCRNSTACPEM